jgi:hypothetical protein
VDRVTHNFQLPRPDKKEIAALAAVLFPQQADPIQELQDQGTIKGTLRSLAIAARQARQVAKGEPVTSALLRRIIRSMGGK